MAGETDKPVVASPASEAAGAETPKTLAMGANGLLVETLQRTLNARLKPSPGLAVDGDFGPGTQAAVLDFQRANGLKETGVVDAHMWSTLGELIDQAPPVPEPATVNSAVIKKQSADAIAGPPFVTCKAWAIGDSATGKLLWGHNHHEPRAVASTTKIMTAYVTIRAAEAHPELLDEVVIFSERADKTSGSAAGVRAGEQISIGELLYGLMLPSGNDASVAIAEHLGAQMPSEKSLDSYEQFVTAMNHTAKELGMKASHFKNPNGLPAKGHLSSAADLVLLTHKAMQQPLFREIVSTIQHGTTVVDSRGKKRNLFWKNTNRLLRIEGYEGVKTGTTRAAGSCLVAYSTRGGRSLVVVILGAAPSGARYIDARNLFRWAWRELGIEAIP